MKQIIHDFQKEWQRGPKESAIDILIKNTSYKKICHVCGAQIGEEHSIYCSVGNDIFRG